MKKFAIFLILTCFAAGFIFAQHPAMTPAKPDARSFHVQSVEGHVSRDGGNNRVNINVGDVLAANTFIRVGLDGTNPGVLVLSDGENTYTIRSTYSGTIADSPAVLRAIRRGSVVRVDTGAVSRTTGAQQTAAARAGDAAHGDDITAEESEY